MDDFLNALLPADGLILFPDIIPQVVFPQDTRLMHLQRVGLPTEAVFHPVLQNPGEYLMRRYAPVEELPIHWEVYSGDNYLGVQQHRQEEFDAPEQVEDMDNEEEDLDDEYETMDSANALPGDANASPHVTKRDDSITDDCRLLNEIRSLSPSSVPSFGLLHASPATFGSTLE